MSGITFSFDASDMSAVDAVFNSLIDAGSNLYPLMDDIGAALVASTQDRFQRGEGPDGQAWEPSQRVLTEGGKTLIDHQILLGSITHIAHSDSVEVGSDKEYAAIHQLGGQAGRGRKVTLPARPYLGIDDFDRDNIADMARDYLLDAMQ